MDRYARLNALLAMLAENGRVAVDQAVAELGASPATIRRDLVHLHEQGLATRTHGGAVARLAGFDLPLALKQSRAQAEKLRIGEAAAALAEPGSTVGLNGGTTTLEVGRELANRAGAGGEDSGYIIVTNAINLASELMARPELQVVVTGGMVRARSGELFGPLASLVLAQVAIDTIFLGVNGFDPAFGASAYSDAEAATNAEMVAAAGRCVVVADSTKVGQRAFARICPTSAVSCLVTDSGVDGATAQAVIDAGVELVVV
jgi:DeoR family transcriptional regulator of aga operon